MPWLSCGPTETPKHLWGSNSPMAAVGHLIGIYDHEEILAQSVLCSKISAEMKSRD